VTLWLVYNGAMANGWYAALVDAPDEAAAVAAAVDAFGAHPEAAWSGERWSDASKMKAERCLIPTVLEVS